jgi:hypothetical protein
VLEVIGENRKEKEKQIDKVKDIKIGRNINQCILIEKTIKG